VEYAPIFTAIGCTVIDNSSAFRTDPEIPLVVPECNPEDVKMPSKVIANPNCSTIGAIVALKPLDDMYGIKRVIYSTYQAVSGAGQEGVNDYRAGMRGEKGTKFPYPIFGNLIPQIDSFLPNGNTKEEEKMVNETRKILHKPNLRVSATTVRVPIENCHSVSINVEFERTPNIDEIKKVMKKSPGIVLCDDPAKLIYPMPITANDTNEVYVGRIRLDESCANCINLFTVSDNIRKGAATNAVQILKLLIK
jgi:aspartate-semialdehyde dehydrogenase